MPLTGDIAIALEQGRARTTALLAPFDDAFLCRQHSPLMSPLVWDLAHVANYEELWLVRALDAPALRPELDDIYDAFKHPRRDRPDLALLDPVHARAYATEVRDRALELLERADLDDGQPLLTDGFVYGMVVQHEHQHDETMLATIQLSGAPIDLDRCGPGAVKADDDVEVAGGSYSIGTSSTPWAYDNERPAHNVEVPSFRIDRWPVTNGDFLAFINGGGYHDERLWHPAGWEWRKHECAGAPLFWRQDGRGDWDVLRFGRRVAVNPDEPVQHVCWYEADAFARWSGKRLPSEREWEVAQRTGALNGAGEVWEWTASDFGPWPEFRSFPYREYSEVFFGPDYKVLRGGSWAVHESMHRPSFRNWDFPIRRQIFAGFRCARDA